MGDDSSMREEGSGKGCFIHEINYQIHFPNFNVLSEPSISSLSVSKASH